MSGFSPGNLSDRPMPEAETLEIARLAELHPDLALFEECAAKLVFRLSINPTGLDPGQRRREIRIEHRPRNSSDTATDLTRVVAWTELDQAALDRCKKCEYTVGEDNLTEWAAIGLMGLLIHNLEGG